MAPKLPAYYAVDESANFIDTNAKTQTDILYFERDTGKYKLGNGERYCDIEYFTPSADVHIDSDVIASIDGLITSKFESIQYELPIDKKTAFNADFGETESTVARGKHKHDVSDIKNLKLPRGVEYPEIPTGKKILYDDGSFGPISTDGTAVRGSKAPISSDWAATHEASGLHLTPQYVSYIHAPVSISGPGLHLEGQDIRLLFGRGSRDVCPGVHDHDEYARNDHVHLNKIAPSRLPSVSRDSVGAVPATGNPSGRSLHDDGSWKYAQALTTIVIDEFWIAPADGKMIFIHAYAQEMMSTSVLLNSKVIARLDTSDAKMHGFYEARKDVEVAFKAGDVFQVSAANTQIGILYMR